MMKLAQQLTQHNLPIKELFWFDEREDVEQVKNPLSENSSLYLFPCGGLLEEGQKLAIDDQYGMVGVYQQNTIVNKVDMNPLELSVLVVFVLSLPLPLYHSLLQNILSLYIMNEEHGEKPDDTPGMHTVHDLILSCNERLKSLGMAIRTIDATYHLTRGSGTDGTE